MFFRKIMLKVGCFKNTNDNRPFLNFFFQIEQNFDIFRKFVKEISFVKLTPLHFFEQILWFSQILFKGISFVKLNLG